MFEIPLEVPLNIFTFNLLLKKKLYTFASGTYSVVQWLVEHIQNLGSPTVLRHTVI